LTGCPDALQPLKSRLFLCLLTLQSVILGIYRRYGMVIVHALRAYPLLRMLIRMARDRLG
jgi:hypothetical protein